jgi:chromosome segregation ATPase
MSQLTKEQYVAKLKKLNEKLRNKLKDLNGRLERVLDRINTKQLLAKKKNKEVPVDKQINVCDKEIENAQKQLDSYKKEILRLTAKVEQLGQVNKVIDLEDEIKSKTEIKSNLKKEIKQLERNIHDQGKELEKLANTDDHHTTLNALTEKLRVWKEKHNKLEVTIQREKKAMEDQSEKVTKLKQEKSSLEHEVEKLMNEKGWKEPEAATK